MSSKDIYLRDVFQADEVVFNEGEQGRYAFLVQSGRVEVYREVEGRVVVLSELGVGEIFGETALLFEEPRAASVRALATTTLVRIDREMFRVKLQGSDPTIKAITEMLSRRVLAANESLVAEQRDVNSLKQATQVLFDNVCEDLPAIKQRIFEEGVKPRFDAFVEAIDALELHLNDTKD